MGISTGRGDDGSTSLLSGERILKDDPHIECLGVLDELDAFLGDAKTIIPSAPLQALLMSIQEEISRIAGAIAARWPKTDTFDIAADKLKEEIKNLEQSLDDDVSAYQKGFAISGGSPLQAKLDIARTVCRRAERRLVSLAKISPCPMGILRYINRLSDLLFLLARQY